MWNIKFRGWGVKDKVMVSVGELSWTVGGLRALGPGCYINVNNPYVQENNIILMVNTGLQDSLGQDIYEGDILEVEGGAGPFFMAVKFENGCFVADAPWVDKGFLPELKYYIGKEFCTTRVIGNIYENPELVDNKTGGKGESKK